MEIEYENLPKPGNRIGSGAFGRIFESSMGNKKVVYKIMKHAVHSSIFYNEIKIMNRLKHPNIVNIIGYTISKKNNLMCIVMDKAIGIDLFDYIHYHDVSSSRKSKISFEMINTLTYIHSKNIIYRDLKPENIIVDLVSGNIKFIDFGIAVIIEPTKKSVRGFAGTLGYMAPEIIKEHDYDFSADIYSYGMTLFFMWSETTPKKRSLMPYYLRKTPRKYCDLIYRSTSIQPGQRPTSCDILTKTDFTVSSRSPGREGGFFCFFC